MIRFTSIAAWIPMGLILCLKKSTWKGVMFHLIFTCAFPALCGILFSSIIDWYYYGFLTLPFVASFHFNVVLGKFQTFQS